MNEFGKKIRELREENNLSAKALGKIIGVSDSTIIRWENGNIIPSIENLYNMAVFFKVTTDYLLGLEN